MLASGISARKAMTADLVVMIPAAPDVRQEPDAGGEDLYSFQPGVERAPHDARNKR
jgi:hypothetical protein